MPHVRFEIPFPYRISPALQVARVRHVAFLRRHGLIKSDASEERYLLDKIPELASMLYPQTDAPGTLLAADLIGWMAFFDDFCSRSAYTPGGVASLCDEFIALTGTNPDRTPRSPLAGAWFDVWERECSGKTLTWQRNALEHWRTFMRAYKEEAIEREGGGVPGLKRYMRLRRTTVGRSVYADLIEAAGGFEIPAHAVESPQLQEMIDIWSDVVGYVNDAYSLEREQAQGEVHNVILVLRAEHQCSLEEAVKLTCQIVDTRLFRFKELDDGFCETGSRLNLDALQWENVERYIDGLRSLMRGNYDWSRITGRYTAKDVLAGSGPGYLADAASPADPPPGSTGLIPE